MRSEAILLQNVWFGWGSVGRVLVTHESLGSTPSTTYTGGACLGNRVQGQPGLHETLSQKSNLGLYDNKL